MSNTKNYLARCIIVIDGIIKEKWEDINVVEDQASHYISKGSELHDQLREIELRKGEFETLLKIYNEEHGGR